MLRPRSYKCIRGLRLTVHRAHLSDSPLYLLCQFKFPQNFSGAFWTCKGKKKTQLTTVEEYSGDDDEGEDPGVSSRTPSPRTPRVHNSCLSWLSHYLDDKINTHCTQALAKTPPAPGLSIHWRRTIEEEEEEE